MSTITIPRETFDAMREAVIAAYAALIEAKTALYGLDGAMGKVVTTWTAIPSCESAWPRVSSTRESMDGLRAFYDVLPKKIAPIDAAFARLGPLVNAVSAAKAVRPQAQGVEPHGWLIDGSLLYRLNEHGNNCDEINVNMVNGSSKPEIRAFVAAALLTRITTPQEPAAPDLLEALQAGPSTLHWLPGGDCTCSQCKFIRLKRAAIAKATGGLT